MATALLILNDDMPYLVDSIVMAMRKQRVAVGGVMNAVLPVRRDAAARDRRRRSRRPARILCAVPAGRRPAAGRTGDMLVAAADGGARRRRRAPRRRRHGRPHDRRRRRCRRAIPRPARKWPPSSSGPRTKASSPSATPTTSSSRACANWNATSRAASACCRTPRTRSTAPAWQNIPGDFDTLSKRADTLSIVKADVEGTLHRDQPLDFIGVRHTDAQGNILGEHCFVGLFTRAATATPLARLPFARGRVAKVLSLAGVRQEGFRAEKFLEILESLPRTEALEADPEWLAQVCSSVVSLYKQPRAKVFARRDVYAAT
jgi:glutamate dehydrogenase